MKLIFLGTAQDGGVPQAGCRCRNCLNINRTAASIALIEDSKAILIDCTPDFRLQYKMLMEKFDVSLSAIYLTHAHWGHYGGLPLLGKEAWNTKNLPLFLSGRFHDFLGGQEPFASLFRNGNLDARIIQHMETTDHNITPILVPHREEFSDTFAFLLILNEKRVLYMPDIDRIDDAIGDLIRSVDLTIIDGTFYNDAELPERDISTIPHPHIENSIVQFQNISDRIIFTHLNHSNPALDEKSAERSSLERLGFRVADDGDVSE